MPILQVSFLSRARAESLAAQPSQAVISITDPGAPAAKLDPQFKDVLRLSFFDALPGEEYLPSPVDGLFDQFMARQIGDFVHKLHTVPNDISIMVHCEFGVSRSAAIALFVEAYAGAKLPARERACQANRWVLEGMLRQHPELQIDIPEWDCPRGPEQIGGE